MGTVTDEFRRELKRQLDEEGRFDVGKAAENVRKAPPAREEAD